MDPEEFQKLGKQRPPASGPAPDPEATRLYNIYAGWTSQLHHWCERYLERSIDCEFIPDLYKFKVYSGQGFYTSGASGVPHLVRTGREEIVPLPRPEMRPSGEQLDEVFRAICLAAARIIGIEKEIPVLAPAKKHASLLGKKRRRRNA